jgi:nitrogen fixation-related uncharacterized protein
MYYPYFVAYMAVGFVICFLVLIWALKNDQFNDQKRARFLPLEEEPETPAGRMPKVRRIEIIALGVLVCAGLAASATVLVLALIPGR